MPRFEVPIVFRGQDNFIVEAATPEEAADRAWRKFKNGDEPDALGNEWQEPHHVGTVRLLAEPPAEDEDCTLDPAKLKHAATRDAQ